ALSRRTSWCSRDAPRLSDNTCLHPATELPQGGAGDDGVPRRLVPPVVVRACAIVV
ncbi:MAG: hypothetical protein AVDCRST_MAG88-4653, partial [uncultured Thermomicrobiales bacterium]